MQPFNNFSMNKSLIQSQILNYATYIHFFPERGDRFVDMRTFRIRIPEVAEYFSFHLSPVYQRSLI